MTLPTPNLDDRSFEQIRDEAIRLIPQYCPEWTNYNPSDPGITLIELFIFVSLFNTLYWCMLWARRRARVAAKQSAV